MGAVYLGVDNYRDGDWIGARGRQAVRMAAGDATPADWNDIPAGYAIAISGQTGLSWIAGYSPTMADGYALTNKAGTARSYGGWYINTAGYMTCTVSATDSAWHLAQVYCMDPSAPNRTSVVDVMDGATVLGAYTKANAFQYSSYWVLAAFTGSVVFRFSRGNSSSLAPLQGIFIDPWSTHCAGVPPAGAVGSFAY